MNKKFRIKNTTKGILNIIADNLFDACCGTGIDGTFTTQDGKTVTVEDGYVTSITGGSSLTAVSGSEVLADGCVSPPLELTTTYYHDGEEETPQLGDTVYTDPAGTMPLQTSMLSGTGGEVYIEGPSGPVGGIFVRTDNEGVSILWTCR